MEVRPLSPDNHALGVFATKSYSPGDIIFEELPFFVTCPHSEDEGRALSSQFDQDIFIYTTNKSEKEDEKPAAKPSSEITGNDSPPEHLKGLMGAAAAFALLSESERCKVLTMYHPDPFNDSKKLNTEESSLLELAQEALQYCQTHARPDSSLHQLCHNKQEGDKKEEEKAVVKAMLVYACNAYEGGRIYETICRVNHSCDANCVTGPPPPPSPPSSQQPTSGNGSNNSKEDSTKTIQRETNHHHRQILRAIIPISAGDEITVSYIVGVLNWADTPTRCAYLQRAKYFTCQCSRCQQESDIASSIPCPTCHERIGGKMLQEEVMWEEMDVTYVTYPHYKSDVCGTSGVDGHAMKSALVMAKKVSEKVAKHLSLLSSSLDEEETPEDAATKVQIEEQLYQMAVSVVGAKHWTTNLLLLSLLSNSLSSFHAQMILGESPDLEELAEAIDSLQRLWSFADDVSLNKCMSSLLLHKQTLGIARALVALGDEKSQKYGAEWVERIVDYVETFEGEGLKKVVNTIHGAWKKRNGGNIENNGALSKDEGSGNKRAKTK